MKKRTEFLSCNPVRYLQDEHGLDYVCVQDLRNACDPASLLNYPCSDSVH
ncbi:MAG: hypothetical protein K2Y14_12975 [Burkholderiales bacterium]|nr:hypothetical protein [Burkholderiales bacterium]